MPHSKSAKKRVRQDDVKRLANKAKKTRIKTETKKLDDHVAAGDAAKAKAQLAVVAKALDKAAKSNVIHKNQASRKKGQAARKVHGLTAK